MQYAPGTTAIWKVAYEWAANGQVSIATAHFVPKPIRTTPHPSNDEYLTMLNWWANWVLFIGYDTLTMKAYFTPVVQPTGGWTRVQINFPDPGFGPPTTTVREAAFLIQRVGAAPGGPVRGRIRLGPFNYSYFTDAPRCRKMTPPTAWTAALLPSRISQQADPTTPVQEVLYNRWTGYATVVDTYAISPRRGAVWARAGYPQGVRGPDRH